MKRTIITLFCIAALSTTANAYAQTTSAAVEQGKAAVSDELKSATIDLIRGLKSAVESGAALAKQEIPQVLWEKVVMDRAFYTALELICVGCIFAFFWFLPSRILRANEGQKYVTSPGNISAVIITIFHGALTVIAIFVGSLNFYTLFQVWFAPRIYIIEWVRGLV
jgi:hypothetical protein